MLDRDAMVARIRAVLGEGPRLRLAVLFGSFSRGVARPDSDVDVAILPADPDLPLAEELALQVALERACGRSVDLVRIDRASTLLRFRAAREGLLLAADPPAEHVRFLRTAAAEYSDFAPALAVAAERFRQRLAASHRRSEDSLR